MIDVLEDSLILGLVGSASPMQLVQIATGNPLMQPRSWGTTLECTNARTVLTEIFVPYIYQIK